MSDPIFPTPSKPERTGAVKALEWTPLSTGWITHTPFHSYEVVRTKHGAMATYANQDFAWGEENTMKAAAQADYERRVLSALSPSLQEPEQEAGASEPDMLDEARKYEGDRIPDMTIRNEPFYSGAQFRAAYRHGYDFARALRTHPVQPAGTVPAHFPQVDPFHNRRDQGPAGTDAIREALEPLLQQTGDGIAAVFEQMLKGNWRDDHGHDVKFNIAMQGLKHLLIRLGNFRADHLGYAALNPTSEKNDG